MATAEKVLDWARSQIGNNGRKYWDHYKGEGTYVNGDVTPYCAFYVSYGLEFNGVPCAWFPNGYAPDSYDVPNDWISKYSLKPGDVVGFDWDDDYRGDHTGFVESVHDWGCVCIEGNTSGGIVDRKQRLWSVILGGIRPKYTNGSGKWISSNGRWWYQHKDGSYTKNAWEKIDGEWFHFDKDGWMQSGWFYENGKWFHLHTEHDGHFGAMDASTIIGEDKHFYIIGADGVMKTGDMTNPNHDGYYGAIQF